MLPPYADESRIVEGVMATVAADAPVGGDGLPFAPEAVNLAPMGPIVDPSWHRLIFRPFRTSTTYHNLKATGEGVFHVTDDALLIARGAIGKVTAGEAGATVRQAEVVRGVVMTEACGYYELRVVQLDDAEPRTTIVMEVVTAGQQRPFLGFNRAKHAVLEAAILATRLHLTGAAPVLAEFDRLQVAVDKTGATVEHQALAELRAFVEAAAQNSVHCND